MPFFSLFKSRSTRELESKIRFRRGKARVQKYIQDAKQSSDKYWKLACEAYRLGDQEQFRMIAAHFLRLQSTIARWQRFLVKLEALELRRNEVSATREFLQSINELTNAINHNASPQEIARMQSEVEEAIEKAKSQEELLDLAMDATGFDFQHEIQPSDIRLDQVERTIAAAIEGNSSAGKLPVSPSDNQLLEQEVRRSMAEMLSHPSRS